MLLVFSRLSISRPLLTNLLSFPLGPNHTFNSLFPCGFGVFSWVRSKPLMAAAAPAPHQQTSGDPRGQCLIWVAPQGSPWLVFPMILGISALTQFSELDCPSCLAKRGFCFFLNPKFHQKTPQLSFSRAVKVLVPWLMKCPWTGPHHVPHQPCPLGLQPPMNFWDIISSRDTQPHLLRRAGHLHFIFHCTSTFLAVPN